MSKNFSNAGGDRDIRVIDDSDRGFVIRAIDHIGARSIAVTFNNDTAPALMLAIGECLPPIPEKVREGSYEAFMAVALEYLGKAVRALEAETAEAEAQAKLEAEALELFNAGDVEGEFQSGPYDSFAQIHDYAKPKWLAVARRAREINKEEK